MPAQATTSDSSDVASRYSHLLQPIRDLTKNWDIDVAAQLEEYLAEIERIKISFDGGKTTMNFAEAALVIQGSACVYSKKVEYLYTLVYQTLDLIASKKRLQQASSVDDQGKDKDASFRDDAAEFLLLDDIKEAKNIDLKEDEEDTQGEGSQIIPRTPLALIPLGEKDKEDVLLSRTGEVLGSRNDFKMNTCTVHASGTLLLDLTHLSLLDGSFKRLMTSTPSAMQDLQPGTDNQASNQDVPECAANAEDLNLPDMDDNFDTPELMDDDAIDDYNEDGGNNVAMETEEGREEQRALRARETQQPRQVQQLPFKDPWKMLDPHDPGSGKNVPFKKGKPFKKPLSVTSQQQKKKRKRQEENKEPTLIPINQFISQAFYSHATKMLKNHLKTPSFPEFEYLYWIEFRRQQTVQAKQKKLLSQRAAKEEIEELKSIIVNTEENEEDQGYDDGNADIDNDDDDFGGGVDDELYLGDADAPEPIEPMALEEPTEGVVISSYEEMVRKYVEGYLTEAQQYAQETELSRRVRDWEERIVPVLSQEDTHRPFDIHKYGEEILTSFKGKSNQDFKELANEKEPFEICRLFLATLQLANNYNVEITAHGEGEKAVDTMRLRLLKTTPGNHAIATFGGQPST
ncbi:hypothetical protein ACROYT_G036651 [Oculina patagonica]